MAITRTQFVHGENDASLATLTTGINGVAPGSLIVVIATCDRDHTVTGVADDLAVNGVAATANQVGVSGTLPPVNSRMFYFANYGGGDRSFTATFSADSTHRGLVIIEYAGVLPASPQDGSGINTNGTTGTADAGTLTPSVDGCLIVGFCANNVAVAAIAPFADVLTGSVEANSFFSASEYFQPVAGAIHPTWNAGGSPFWLAIAAAFKPVDDGAGTTSGDVTITATCEGVDGTAVITVTV